jgi:hypothetical protein
LELDKRPARAFSHLSPSINFEAIPVKEMKPSEWIKAQPTFLGAQGKTIFDPDFDIDDGCLPHEKVHLPK